MKNLFFKLHLLILVFFQIFSAQKLYAQQDIVLDKPNQGGIHAATRSIKLAPGFTSANGFHAYIINTNCLPNTSVPTLSKAYVMTWTSRIPGVTDVSKMGERKNCEVNQSIQYLDGLGRSQQLVQTRATPDATRDVITTTTYDQFGREQFKHLPYTSGGILGSFREDALKSNAGVYDFYNPPGSTGSQLPNGLPRIPTPFSETLFEPSPLNRVLEQGQPGDSWSLSSGHTVKTSYTSNNDLTNPALPDFRAVRRFKAIDSSGNHIRKLVSQGWYPVGSLTVVTTKNENWVSGRTGTVEVFTDREERVIAKRIWETEVTPLSTYYVYDNSGNLSFVLTPGSAPDYNETITEQVLSKFCYQYAYDARNRQIEKTIPGKGKTELVYNNLDQLVLTRDARQASEGKWILNKYDALGRIIITAVVNSTLNRAQWQSEINNQAVFFEERDNANTSNTGTGYSNQTRPFHNQISQYLTVNYFDDHKFYGNTIGQPSSSYRQDNHTLATGSKVKILDTDTMLLSVNYYDEYGRLAQTKSQNHLQGTDIVTNSYDFTGALLASKREHTGVNNQSVTVSKRYEYDHTGRKIKSYQRTGSEQSPEVLLATLVYNEIGEIKQQLLHNDLQHTYFTYNPRGWLKTKVSEQFSLELKYDDSSTPQYNGNIGNQTWGQSSNAATNVFTYNYDKLNRLTSALSPGMNETIHGYDAMGNITGLTREGKSGTYQYNGNQLTKIVNGALSTGDYAYDLNGNVITDGRLNKSITYNLLDLPASFSGGITYTYSAKGEKLKMVGTDRSDYVDGIQYLNNQIEFVQTDYGVARRNGANYGYEYRLTDNLGNTRASFQYNENAKKIEVFQYENYFAFGLRVPSFVSPNSNKYLYNGKELQEEIGQYDYGARFYDPVIGRWSVVDAMASDVKQIDKSPYAYAWNNPISLTDPDGNCPSCPDLGDPLGNGMSYIENAIYNFRDKVSSGIVTVGTFVANHITNGAVPVLKIDYVYNENSRIGKLGVVNGNKNIAAVKGFIDIASSMPSNGPAGTFLAKTTESKSTLADLTKSTISGSDAMRIENAATRINKPITVVGSRASGTAKATSDWDYVIPNISNKEWKKVKNSLPGASSKIDNSPRMIDIFKDLNKEKPHVTFNPRKQ